MRSQTRGAGPSPADCYQGAYDVTNGIRDDTRDNKSASDQIAIEFQYFESPRELILHRHHTTHMILSCHSSAVPCRELTKKSYSETPSSLTYQGACSFVALMRREGPRVPFCAQRLTPPFHGLCPANLLLLKQVDMFLLPFLGTDFVSSATVVPEW